MIIQSKFNVVAPDVQIPMGTRVPRKEVPTQEAYAKAIATCLTITRIGSSHYEVTDVSAAWLKSPMDFNMFLSIAIQYDLDRTISPELATEKISQLIALEFI